MRIGIMGGTFDPVHYGHLVTAEAARFRFALDRVLFIPSGNPPHKKSRPVSPARHRYLMTILATSTNPHFEVSTVEMDRVGYSYTVDTLEEVRATLQPEDKLYFITGSDAVLELLTWRDPARLISLCEFIAATRPGYSADAFRRQVRDLEERYGAAVHEMVVPALSISSSDIRQRVQDGRPIKYLVPESVESYILKNSLYLRS